MTDKEKLKLIDHRLDHELRFAYSYKKEETLADVLSKKDRFKKVRLEAERAAMQNRRIEDPDNRTELAHLIEKGDITIWDLREEKKRLE